MFLKKIKNDNRGLDIALVGTNYILVLVLIICAAVDFSIMSLGKLYCVSMAKESALYALAKNFEYGLWMEKQTFNTEDGIKVQRAVEYDALTKFREMRGTVTPTLGDITLSSRPEDKGVVCNYTNMALICTFQDIVFTPNGIFKRAGRNSRNGSIGFIGSSTGSNGGKLMSPRDGSYGTGVYSDANNLPSIASGGTIHSGVSCKVQIFLSM